MYILHILQNDQNKWMAILGPMGNDKEDTNLYWFSRLTGFAPASMIKSEGEIRSLSWKGTKRESYFLLVSPIYHFHLRQWSKVRVEKGPNKVNCECRIWDFSDKNVEQAIICFRLQSAKARARSLLCHAPCEMWLAGGTCLLWTRVSLIGRLSC